MKKTRTIETEVIKTALNKTGASWEETTLKGFTYFR